MKLGDKVYFFERKEVGTVIDYSVRAKFHNGTTTCYNPHSETSKHTISLQGATVYYKNNIKGIIVDVEDDEVVIKWEGGGGAHPSCYNFDVLGTIVTFDKIEMMHITTTCGNYEVPKDALLNFLEENKV